MAEAAPLAACYAHAALALRPEPELTVSAWADAHRFLAPSASGEPGPWRTDRTPYLREVMDCLAPASPVERVVLMKGAQTGGTEAGNNWIGYVIHHAPGPLLAVQPTVELGKRWSRQRLAPLIEGTPVLRARVKEPRARDSGNTVQSKEFPGGILVVTGANSAVGLRSMPVRYLFLDEVDAYPFDADGEGDPVALAIQRTVTFTNRKLFLVSTPTVEGLSRIEREYQASDRRRYLVPCPACGERQALAEERLRWPQGRPEAAAYRCAACDAAIPSHRKAWMNARGRWRAEAAGDGTVAGFHLSGLYSPWLTWADIARRRVAAGDDAALKVYVNTVAARTWRERGEAPDWQRLYDRREDYPIGTVPAGGRVLTAGADVQRDRIEVEVVAWGEGLESWSVDHRVLPGDPGRPEVWARLDGLLAERFRHAGGVELAIALLAIDSGYATQEVYAWCRRQGAGRVLAVKGSERAYAALGAPSPVEVTVAGRRRKRGARVWPVGTGLLKGELLRWLSLERPTDEELAAGAGYPPGYCHFPKYGAEHFKQLGAERLVTKVVRGYPRREWVKVRERNEALDCRVYARAAAAALGLERWGEGRWRQLEAQLGLEEARPEAVAPPVERPAPAAAAEPAASGWLRQPAGSGWLRDPRGAWLGRRVVPRA